MDLTKVRLYKRVAWINVFYLFATPLGVALLAPLYFYREGWNWWMMLTLVASCAITNLSITGGYHRLFAHRSYDAKPWVRFMYLLVGAAAFQGPAAKWATDHRRHHREVDTGQDPYNIKRGFFWAHMGWLMMLDDPKYKNQFAPDFMKDRMVMLQEKYYIPLALITGFGVPTLIGWAMGSALGGLVLLGGVRLVFTNHTTFFINSLCHMVGKQPYTDENSARDSFIMAILATGEGYHNFHHYFQADYRNGVRWYHFDPTKWMVRTMSYFGWAYKLRRTPPNQILTARLRMDEKRMIQQGAPAEYVALFRTKVEEAQSKARWLAEEYKRHKVTMQAQSRKHLQQLKWELKAARRDFRLAWLSWRAYQRGLRPAAVTS
jgi:stearoyl-CoA desaturase (Delta-9 desaturase)